MPKSLVLEILDFVKGSPETMDYGRWGALNPEQRHLIKKLCKSWLILDKATTEQTKRIEKAIEYIDWQRRNPQYDNVWRNSECEDLIEILNGEEEV